MTDFKDRPLEFYYHAVIEDERTKRLMPESSRKDVDYYWLTSNKGHLYRFSTIDELRIFCFRNGIRAVLAD
ncbi:MAG: hypothetical protein KBT11_00195 [Treponema sp.]|nr:hypothetical protein [Candidatus Treponema equifaecale]